MFASNIKKKTLAITRNTCKKCLKISKIIQHNGKKAQKDDTLFRKLKIEQEKIN